MYRNRELLWAVHCDIPSKAQKFTAGQSPKAHTNQAKVWWLSWEIQCLSKLIFTSWCRIVCNSSITWYSDIGRMSRTWNSHIVFSKKRIEAKKIACSKLSLKSRTGEGKSKRKKLELVLNEVILWKTLFDCTVFPNWLTLLGRLIQGYWWANCLFPRQYQYLLCGYSQRHGVFMAVRSPFMFLLQTQDNHA